jgi:HD-like signal output (HDOD) protein
MSSIEPSLKNTQEIKIPEVLQPSVLFLAENADELQSLREIFRKEKLHLFFLSEVKNALEQIKKNRIDLVVAQPSVHWGDYLHFLAETQTARPETIRMCVGTADKEPTILDAIASGILSMYIVQPFSSENFKKMVLDTVQMQHQDRVRNFKKKLNSFRSLPAPERFQVRLKQLLAKKDKSLRELVLEIEKNPALVAKILQVANSVQYWTRVPISTVWDGVVFIGTENVAGLVAAIEVFENLGKSIPPDIRAYYELLWERSLRRANIAKKISEEWKEVGQPQAAYVAAILQDIGLLVRLSNEPKRYLEMINIAREKNVSLCEAELSVFSNSHPEVGALVLEMWNFPKEIVFAVAHHHGLCYDDPLTQIIQIADLLYTSDRATPHDASIDAFAELWRMRIENLLVVPAGPVRKEGD